MIKLFDEGEDLEKGKYHEGVFCDITGTLLDFEGNIRDMVLEMLKKYEEQGKIVYLWTTGNISDVKQLLSFHFKNIPWEIFQKNNYKEHMVEIVIDDLSEEDFKAIYNIGFIEYIRV